MNTLMLLPDHHQLLQHLLKLIKNPLPGHLYQNPLPGHLYQNPLCQEEDLLTLVEDHL